MNALIHSHQNTVTDTVAVANRSTSLIQSIVQRHHPHAPHENILTTIGNTPIVRISKLAPAHVEIYAKLEAFNPLGSLKDRLALGIIEAAERSGALTPGQTVVEATSGNTGIGLAMVCAQKGYPLVVTMAENFSIERRRLMRYLGAQVILTPAVRMGSGMLAKARELAETHGWFLCNQFSNDANADVHSATTAREILSSFPDGTLDYFITGFGTGGTLKGIARVLRQQSENTCIIAAEPDNAPVMRSGLPQTFTATGDPAHGHSAFRPHLMQGWAPDFMSKLTHDAVTGGLIDRVEPVNGNDALLTARKLARQEGIFCGTSGGATLAAALSVAKTAPSGSRLLCILPDTGERYLSTPLFDEVASEMSEQEISLSQSTPGYRFDAPKVKTDPKLKPKGTLGVSSTAIALFDSIVKSQEEPLVMFGLEWCEFCWSVRKLFDRLGVVFRNIDLDCVEYQRDGLGSELRVALVELTGKTTIPQLFLGGQHLGGCTEIFNAYRDGSLQRRFHNIGMPFSEEADLDPSSLLPGWLHPR